MNARREYSIKNGDLSYKSERKLSSNQRVDIDIEIVNRIYEYGYAIRQ